MQTGETPDRSTLVLLPVKRLSGAKMRLAGLLSQDERCALVLAMLGDVLDAVRSAGLIPRVLTPDPDVLSFAGAAALRQHHGVRTLNDALTRALHEEGLSALSALVLLPDTPLATADEVRALVSRRHVASPKAAGPGEDASEPWLAMATDRAGRGTNALYLNPPSAIPMSFGRGSLARHLKAAAETGVRARIEELQGLALDIDTPSDVSELLARPGETRTHRLLRELRAGDRLP